MSHIFDQLPPAPPDPIFGIAAEAAAAGPGAINATIGVILDEEGKVSLLPSVAKAAAEVAVAFGKTPFSYPPVIGVTAFHQTVCGLLGLDYSLTACLSATGGTGAVAAQLRLLRVLDPSMKIIVATPTWANHYQLINDVRMPFIDVSYLKDGRPTIDGIVEALESSSGPVAVLLQSGCHNPTGLDFNASQWEELAHALHKKHAVALLDMAYQGLAGEPEEDIEPLKILRRSNVTTLVAWSASKNHSIYGLRTGLACVPVDSAEEKQVIESHYVPITRGMHSAASTIGQQIVIQVQQHHKDEWRSDLQKTRLAMKHVRSVLAERCPRVAQALVGNGMFALLPLSADQIAALKYEKIFVTNDGRMNVAGIPSRQLERFAEVICSV